MGLRIELIELDLDNPESFQYRVFNDDVFVVSFATLAEANDFVVNHDGTAQLVLPFERGISAKTDTPTRHGAWFKT